MTAAGMLYFAEDMAKRVLPEVVKNKPLERAALERSLDDWSAFFERNYTQLEEYFVDQMQKQGLDPKLQLEQDTVLIIAGVDETGPRFLIVFHSKENFKANVLYKEFQTWIPALYPDGMKTTEVEKFNKKLNQAIRRRLERLRAMGDELERVKRAAIIMPEVIALAAQEDDSVSKEYDLVTVGPEGSRRFSG